jgi:very-short-patch-repair endonuclease
MIWPYILDFYCARLMLGIEIDGSSHDDKQIYDAVREEYLHKKWIMIVRYTNEEVMSDVKWVKKDLERVIKERRSYFV